MRKATGSSIASAGIWLVALALFVRVLVPTGFMLAPVAGKSFPQLWICNDASIASASHATGHGGEHEPAAPERGTEQHCAFTLHVADAPPTAAAPTAPLAGLTEPALAAHRTALRSGALAAPPPPATGPPSSADI